MAAVVLASASAAVPSEVASAALHQRPNIVLILTDDQRWDTLWAMPNVQQELVAEGVSFSNAFVVNALCCPSRASILTGQYSHTTGVYGNPSAAPYGGVAAFDDSVTIATALNDLGYRTALIGKYMNGYETSTVPPGWDRWFGVHSNGLYYGYTFTDDGVVKTAGTAPEDYNTTVLADQATAFIRGTDQAAPLFLMVGTMAPHASASQEPPVPAPGDGNAFSGLKPWRPPSFDEANVGDKPKYVRRLSPLSPTKVKEIDRFRRKQYESLLEVDRLVGRIIGALTDTGRLSNTLIVFTSDNGYLWGEHRLDGKQVPYEESIRVPYVVRFDSVTASGFSMDELVLNIDLGPTFADAAGTRLPNVDGSSLMPLLSSTNPSWRQDFLVEHYQARDRVPTYCQVRSKRLSYVRYDTGEEELYRISSDPYELRSLDTEPDLQQVLDTMRQRVLALCQPPPPGYSPPPFP